jgi:hypothetical protein
LRSSTHCADAARRIGALVLGVAGLSASTVVSAAVDLEATPAWGGWSRPGRVTEVEVRLTATEDTAARIIVEAAGDVIQSEATLKSGVAVASFIPVLAADTVGVRAEAKAASTANTAVRLSLSESPLLARISSAAAEPAVEGFHVIDVDPSRMPHNAAAYASIDGLAIDRPALAALTHEQLAALLSYVAGCGRTILVGASTSDEQLFRTAVGCGGRRFAIAQSAAEIGPRLADILAARDEQMPGPVSLAAVDGHDLRAWYFALVLLAVAAAAIAVAGILTTSLWAAVLVPGLAAAGILILIQTRPVGTDLIVWAETGSGEHLARYVGLQQAGITRRGAASMPVLSELGRPRACRDSEHVVWIWDGDSRRFTSAKFTGRLFGRGQLCYSGEFPVARVAALRPAAQGDLTISNSGASRWPPGLLAWHGAIFPISALDAGAEVSIDPSAGAHAAGPVQETALMRTSIDGASILWPLDLSRVEHAPPRAHGWLLLRLSAQRDD